MTGKKILIVTGSDYAPQVYSAFEKVQSEGHTLYLLSDGLFEPRPGIFKEHFKYDLRRTNEVVEYMRAQPVRFDAVTIKTSEWLTPLVALLAKEYKAIGNEPLVAFNCRSKYHMRKVMQDAGIASVRFALCRSFDDIQIAAKELGTPCVAKPVGGNASYGTFLIKSLGELPDKETTYNHAIEYLKKKAITEDVFAFSLDEMKRIGVKEPVDMVTDYLVEEFIPGHEISIDSLVHRGNVEMMGIADQERMRPPFFVQLGEAMPYESSKDIYEAIKKLNRETIEAFGIKNSPVHLEIIFSPEGPKVVELACRIGGDNIHDSVLQTTGYNLMYEAIQIALGSERRYKIEEKGFTAMRYLLPTEEGYISQIDLPESVRNNANVTEIDISAKVGDFFAPPPKSFDFLGYIQVRGKSSKEARSLLERVLSEVKITYSSKPLSEHSTAA